MNFSRIGAEKPRLRDLEDMRIGTVIMATSAPLPRYFVKVRGGFKACDPGGNTWVNDELADELDGWPEVLPERDIRRPAIVVAIAVDEVRSA